MQSSAQPRRFYILLADDDAEDAFTVRRGFQKSDLDFEIMHVSDGEELLEFLNAVEAKQADEPDEDSDGPRAPDLVLLDINMPRLNGFEVLDRMRASPEFSAVPVVILTSSSNDADVTHCYRLGARSYFVKPLTLGEMSDFVDSIVNYWFKGCVLPGRKIT